MNLRAPLSTIHFEAPVAVGPKAESSPYPGSSATAFSLLQMAEEYRLAANVLLRSGRKGQAASFAPFRLVAIHAIELYLSAFLIDAGDTPESVRGLGHNLASRTIRAKQIGLVLRQRTSLHMQSLSDGREYLVSRYAVELLGSMSQLNRLTASLEEIAVKVRQRLRPAPLAL